MPDHFATLQQPRRPWLDGDALKDAFHALTAAHHPDVARSGAIDFADINAAYSTLRDPRTRLRHLLELEAPAALEVTQPIPPALAEIFMQLGAHRSALENFTQRETAASGPLAKALLHPEKRAVREKVDRLLGVIEAQRAQALDELRAIDAKWDTERPIARLAEILHALSFLGRWSDQLEDDTLKLSL